MGFLVIEVMMHELRISVVKRLSNLWENGQKDEKREDHCLFPSHLMLRPNQIYKTKKQTRMWIQTTRFEFWWFCKVLASRQLTFQTSDVGAALEYNFSKWPALIKKIRAYLSPCFHKIIRSLYIHVGGYSALTSTWLTYSASLSLDVEAAVESGCREQLTQDYSADAASHNIVREIIIFLFEVFVCPVKTCILKSTF